MIDFVVGCHRIVMLTLIMVIYNGLRLVSCDSTNTFRIGLEARYQGTVIGKICSITGIDIIIHQVVETNTPRYEEAGSKAGRGIFKKHSHIHLCSSSFLYSIIL